MLVLLLLTTIAGGAQGPLQQRAGAGVGELSVSEGKFVFMSFDKDPKDGALDYAFVLVLPDGARAPVPFKQSLKFEWYMDASLALLLEGGSRDQERLIFAVPGAMDRMFPTKSGGIRTSVASVHGFGITDKNASHASLALQLVARTKRRLSQQ